MLSAKFWNKWGFEILLLISFVIFVMYYITRLNEKGTYLKPSADLFYSIPKYQKPKPKIVTTSKGEMICKQVMENIFKKPFNKVRPDFLKNQVTGKCLELDIFNEEMKLAVEYNGQQHYKYTPYFHKSYEAFLNQRYRDEMKKVKCTEAGIKLIEVPCSVPNDKIEEYILKRLEEFNINVY
jgi:hypothetical protein